MEKAIVERAAPVRVRMRGRRQITLPASVVRSANIDENALLNVSVQGSTITLTTQQAAQKKRRPLAEWIGCLKGTYGSTTAEQDAYVANERASWER